MSPSPRFTLRCLAELGVPVPAHPRTLDDVDHPLLAAAKLLWGADEHHTERIVSIDDMVLLKCKPNVPWRAAVWEDSAEDNLPWLVAAGKREQGSRKDLYEALSAQCQRERKARNRRGVDLQQGKNTYSKHLLPTDDDRLRLRLDRFQEQVAAARASVNRLVDLARHQPGTVVTAHAFGADIDAIVIRTDLDELYVCIAVAGAAPPNVHQVVLSLAVPGLEADDWQPVASAPQQPARPNQIVWMTLLSVPRLG